MSTQSQNGYMLIFRGTDWYQGLSPEQMQQIADNWMAWFNRLKEGGRAIAGNPLEREGKIVSGKNRMVSDGPFAETKETIGGYFFLNRKTTEEAVALPPELPRPPVGHRRGEGTLGGGSPRPPSTRRGAHAWP